MDSVIITDGQFTILGLELDVVDDATSNQVVEDGSGDTIVNG